MTHPDPLAPECANPSAPTVPCAMCGKTVHTCERETPVNGDYRCPVHPDGAEVGDDGDWVCSETCGGEWDSQTVIDIRSALAPLRRFLELADKDGAPDETALVLDPMSVSELKLGDLRKVVEAVKEP